MIRVNENFLELAASYLFSEIAQRVRTFAQKNPSTEIIRLGIGDVTLPLPEVCRQAFHRAIDEMGAVDTFRGYGPEQGYDFLREAIANVDYQANGLTITADEVFVSDGSKCDTGSIQELFANEIRIAIPDPVYPVYRDTNIMAGRTNVTYLPSTKENGYVPRPPTGSADLIYLCSPNNPTGATATRAQLTEWVEYARKHQALILFDAAYEAFIRDPQLPRSIYEIPGARELAIEFRSLSKTAGFTGTRCAYTVVPKDCVAYDRSGKKVALHPLWFRRQSTKFNGVSYPVQRAAEAVYSAAGQKEVRQLTDYYLKNAANIRRAIEGLGLSCVGGDNSPYIWVETGQDSWQFFDRLLEKAGVVCTPGVGFGSCGEGHIRISAFNSHDNVNRALERIKGIL